MWNMLSPMMKEQSHDWLYNHFIELTYCVYLKVGHCSTQNSGKFRIDTRFYGWVPKIRVPIYPVNSLNCHRKLHMQHTEEVVNVNALNMFKKRLHNSLLNLDVKLY